MIGYIGDQAAGCMAQKLALASALEPRVLHGVRGSHSLFWIENEKLLNEILCLR
jgi:hypothetical protein